MNIAKAKEQMKYAMTAYFAKDDLGNYRIPPQKQRPVFLIGPPGIGKTAIMEQLAGELGVGLVSYSMTHHTRQSALGLPYITTQEYEGKSYRVSEYTMSEIIGSIYELMRETGEKEGILFLDEINCVSETLAPSMLQFLQYKVFGRHKLPPGWIVVTAGNPPEYNRSARDFDVVTWDRLKRIDVEPDYDIWKQYAVSRGVHPAVLTYLDARKKDFYKVENTVDGKKFVTPRGWDDLSEMIRLFEENDIKVDEDLICQYLRDERIVKDFAIYYDIFNKYRSDYQVDTILAGTAPESVRYRAERAEFDERVSLLGLLFDSIRSEVADVWKKERTLDELTPVLKNIKNETEERVRGRSIHDVSEIFDENIRELTERLDAGRRSSSMTQETQYAVQRALAAVHDIRGTLMKQGPDEAQQLNELLNRELSARVAAMRDEAEKVKDEMENVFDFCEQAFGEGEEILLLVTEMTVDPGCAHFIGNYGCDGYFRHNQKLQFRDRREELMKRAEVINKQRM